MSHLTPAEVAKNKPPANTVVHLTRGCTATGLVRAGTQWTKRLRLRTQNRLKERNFRTH